jgi:hypothetical protein
MGDRVPRRGRSVRDQVGQAWIFVPIALVILLVYINYGDRIGSREYRPGQRGARNSAQLVRTPARLRRAAPGGPSGAGAGGVASEEDRTCTGTIPVNARRLIAQSILGDVVGCVERHQGNPAWRQPPTGLTIMVDEEGRVEGLDVSEGDEVPDIFITCLQRAGAGWQLPEPHGGGCAMVEISLARGPGSGANAAPIVPQQEPGEESDQEGEDDS